MHQMSHVPEIGAVIVDTKFGEKNLETLKGTR